MLWKQNLAGEVGHHRRTNPSAALMAMPAKIAQTLYVAVKAVKCCTVTVRRYSETESAVLNAGDLWKRFWAPTIYHGSTALTKESWARPWDLVFAPRLVSAPQKA